MITAKKNTLGSTIRTLRLKKGVKQTDFASKIGISQTAISQMECGAMRPSLTTIVKIAKVLDTTPIEIIQLTIGSTKCSDVIDFIFKIFKR